MKIFDVSMPIDVNMPVYKNEPSRKPELIEIKSIEKDGVAITKILLDLHTGTHMDAPRHYFEDGSSIDQVKMTQEVTNAQVIDLTRINGRVITKEILETKSIKENHVILLKTQNSYEDQFEPEFVYLSEEAAVFLVSKNIKGVGIDSLTIERNQPNHGTHKSLLSNQLIIIEGLRLRFVDEGVYTIVALPLKIVGAEAAPTRVLLIQGL